MLMQRGLMNQRMGLGAIDPATAALALEKAPAVIAKAASVAQAVQRGWNLIDDAFGTDDSGTAQCAATGQRLPNGAFPSYICDSPDGTSFTCPSGYQPVKTSAFHSAPKQRLGIIEQSMGRRVCVKVETPTPCALPGVVEQSRIFQATPKRRIAGAGRPDGGAMRNGRICLSIARPMTVEAQQMQAGTTSAQTAGISGDSIVPALALGAAVLYFATR